MNKQGYATLKIDPFSEKFTQYAEGQFLEIGAAFGYTTLLALENGASVIANDLDERHLLELERAAKERGLSKLQTQSAEFPVGLNFPAKSFRKILICRVLHFFSGLDIKKALKKVFDWLEPGGELYVVCETTYLKNGLVLEFLPSKLQQDEDIVITAMMENPFSVRYAAQSLLDKKSFYDAFFARWYKRQA